MLLRIAYIGNFGPPGSTENDLRWTLEQMGHEVTQLQEEVPASWSWLDAHIGVDLDMVLWTRTAGLAAQVPLATQRGMQLKARRAGIPTVGYHLDRWWGLSREPDVLTEPWFMCEHVFTPDGAHDDDWALAGVNHHYMPPAICARKVMQGSYREDYAFDIVFVGSWMGGYHAEWAHRQQLIDHLRQGYGRRVGFFPQRQGDPRIDGADRADLFASAKVVVGDSCLVPLADGTPMHHYCSDRVFETIGQGGLLLHPQVTGILGEADGDLLTAGEHALSWELYNWADLDSAIESVLNDPTQYAEVAHDGYEEVAAHHTYTQRLQDALDIVFPAGS